MRTIISDRDGVRRATGPVFSNRVTHGLKRRPIPLLSWIVQAACAIILLIFTQS
jgi:hypothetical protein